MVEVLLLVSLKMRFIYLLISLFISLHAFTSTLNERPIEEETPTLY